MTAEGPHSSLNAGRWTRDSFGITWVIGPAAAKKQNLKITNKHTNTDMDP